MPELRSINDNARFIFEDQEFIKINRYDSILIECRKGDAFYYFRENTLVKMPHCRVFELEHGDKFEFLAGDSILTNRVLTNYMIKNIGQVYTANKRTFFVYDDESELVRLA